MIDVDVEIRGLLFGISEILFVAPIYMLFLFNGTTCKPHAIPLFGVLKTLLGKIVLSVSAIIAFPVPKKILVLCF